MATDGDGVTTLVTLHGCPLNCRYCLNSQCKDSHFPCDKHTAKDIVDICMQDNLYFLATGGGITVGGGEPLLHPRFIKELRETMPAEWNMFIETSLNVPLDNILFALENAKMLIIDIKDINNTIYKDYTEISNERLIANLRYIAEQGLQGKCFIRLPLIPLFNTIEDRDKSKAFLQSLGFTTFDDFEYIQKEHD